MVMIEINDANDNVNNTPFQGQESRLSFDQHAVKLIYSRQSLARVSISNGEGVGVWSRMIKLQKSHRNFDFSYFYCSKLARQTDWLTAISGDTPTCSTNHQKRHRPGMRDWHNIVMRLCKSRSKTFVIVLDNAVDSKSFTKMKGNLVDALSRHRRYLRPAVKYLLVKRKTSLSTT
jgi:hypothetical protein